MGSAACTGIQMLVDVVPAVDKDGVIFLFLRFVFRIAESVLD